MNRNTQKKIQLRRAAALAACALTVAAWPLGNAWASSTVSEDENGKTLTTTDQVNLISNATYEGNSLDAFSTVNIQNETSAGSRDFASVIWGNYTGKVVDLSDTDFHVTVTGSGSNANGLHITGNGGTVSIGDFSGRIETANSDGISIGNEAGGSNTLNIGSISNLTVVNGSGIRANAISNKYVTTSKDAVIQVAGDTHITINGGMITDSVTLDNDAVDRLVGDQTVFGDIKAKDQIGSIKATASYAPAAVYAGDDMYRFDCDWERLVENSNLDDGIKEFANSLLGQLAPLEMGNESLGQGKIILHDTYLTIEKPVEEAQAGGYGLFAGKNGAIEIKGNLQIESQAANSYGIAAKNANLIYGDSLQANAEITGMASFVLGDQINAKLTGYPLDESKNTHGTSVTLGENKDVSIVMNGANSYALYAEGVDDTAERNQNRIVSEGEGIGTLWIFGGDVMAENSGLIDLKVTGNEQNYLEGDIKAYGTTENVNVGATVNLSVKNALSGQGTLAAANGGVVNLTLGADSNWTGRADDYQDAESDAWDSHAGNIANAFGDKEISSSGTVKLTMGNWATWNVTGQSWITELSGDNSFISLGDDETGSNALHIGKLTGTNTFVMNVRPTETGDMLYVKDGTGADTQNLIINNRDEVLENMAEGDKIRFATVESAGGGFKEGDVNVASGTFGRSTRISGAGVFNVNFGIEYHNYGENVTGDKAGEDAETANGVYNGDSFDADKPGSDYVEGNYGVSDASGQSLRAAGDDASDAEDLNGTQNVYIVREANTMENLSGAGKTIIAMSKVNYSNAVYMDRLNKRMGEARYLTGDDGLWVRLRHDRIGKDDAFRSMNTMFELGYDWKDEDQTDGTHYRGFAFDYMRGTADYQNVAGDGDVRRAGLWYHDTWLGDSGHYTDYVVKYGRLSNDFDIYSELGDKIDGDYDNDVWSVSAEYGRKKDLGNDWYFEPQAQLQYAYVTSADYTTSQGTKVDLDAIDSLIGRAGFRLGRDTSEGNTVYFKADLLHEFLGDQDIRAQDATGVLSTTYENEGTWYDVGFGFSHRMSKDKYMFLDVEKLFGNDNEDTYQVNIGLNMAF